MLGIRDADEPVMDIELRLLRSLVAIYERGSLSRAAEQLCCTQAAMSMRLKMLEDEVGNQLFLRRHHRMEPTAIGSEIYAKALGVLASYDELIATMRSREVIQKVRIGVPDDYAFGFLSTVMRQLRHNMADIELEILCDLSANLVAALQRQDLDCALVTLVSPPTSARMVVEAELRWVFHPSYRPDTQVPLMLSAYPEGCVFRRAMISALEAAQIPWRVVTQSRSHAGVLSAVRAGIAITSMAQGTVPSDLASSADIGRLPKLDSIPIYLMRPDSTPNPAVILIEDAIRNQLELAHQQA